MLWKSITLESAHDTTNATSYFFSFFVFAFSSLLIRAFPPGKQDHNYELLCLKVDVSYLLAAPPVVQRVYCGIMLRKKKGQILEQQQQLPIPISRTTVLYFVQ